MTKASEVGSLVGGFVGADAQTPSPTNPPSNQPTHQSQARTGAQILCEALIRQGVDTIFGIPGGAIMPFYHALPEYADQLHHVLCRHEQGAGHAAEGYARANTFGPM